MSVAAAAVTVLVLAGGGFLLGRITAPPGVTSLADAVRLANAGKLPCGDAQDGSARHRRADQTAQALCDSGAVAPGRQRPPLPGDRGGPGMPGGPGFPGGRGGVLGMPGAGMFGPGAITGTVGAMSDGTLTVQTRAGAVTITVPANPSITTTTTGSAKDLVAGARVVVKVSTDSAGNRTAEEVYVLPPE
ncbi:MAG: hypothetical protein HYR62_04620 [Actinobacteria bacterium]|nr:hypothetical protein [Actinomycetota bacterium]MBI3686497.1 hypothetical protein [Actinomycetota bacterium]